MKDHIRMMDVTRDDIIRIWDRIQDPRPIGEKMEPFGVGGMFLFHKDTIVDNLTACYINGFREDECIEEAIKGYIEDMTDYYGIDPMGNTLIHQIAYDHYDAVADILDDDPFFIAERYRGRYHA